MDFNQLVNNITGDVLYLDPTYIHRQYIACYHLLENIALWEKPPLSGKTGKFKRDHLKSDYSRKTGAPAVFSEMIEKADAGHISLAITMKELFPMILSWKFSTGRELLKSMNSLTGYSGTGPVCP